MQVYDTLGALVSGGFEVHARCEKDGDCWHGGMVDLDLAIRRLGAGFNFVERREEFRSKLVCTYCQRRAASFVLLAPDGYSDARKAH